MFNSRKKAQSEIFNHGWNCAFLGLDNNNPYPVNTPDHYQFEWGYNAALDELSEMTRSHYERLNDYCGCGD